MIGLRRIALGLVVALAGATFLPAAMQAQSGSRPMGRFALEEFLGRAGARASEYFSLFKDLTAEETKTVEEVRASGEVSRRRVIVSDFIVYRSQVDGGSVAEYRDVHAVDGDAVAGREQRVLALFQSKGRTGSVRDELKRVNREGSRYDLDRTVSGLTIGQALPLQAWARAFFDFAVAGEEQVSGRRCLVVTYEQAAPNPRFGFDLALPGELEREPPRYRGRLWLDAETAHVLREVREVTARAAGSTAEVVLQRTVLDYEPSRFGIPMPRRVVFGTYLRISKTDGRFASSLDFRITFAYGPFRQFTTTSDEGQIAAAEEPPAAPASAPDPAPVAADESLGPEFGPDAPLGPPTPAPAPVPAMAARRAAPPRSAPAAAAAPVSSLAAPTSLPASVRPPERPIVSVLAPAPPPEPDRRPLRLPPS